MWSSVFSLSTAEARSLWDLVATVRQELARTFAPAGFNIGINDGVAAGQTVPHAHVHIIPRYAGDVTRSAGRCALGRAR